jgi:hypothetical protein
MASMTRAVSLSLLLAALQVPAFAQPQQPEPAGPAASEPAAAKKTLLEPADFTTKASGLVELVVGRDSPIYAEFQGSPALTQRLREALQARGFELATDASSSRATLQFRGEIVLMGGPKFYKGVKASIGEATEKALKLAKESGQVTTAERCGAQRQPEQLHPWPGHQRPRQRAGRNHRHARLVQHRCRWRSARHLPEQVRGLE